MQSCILVLRSRHSSFQLKIQALVIPAKTFKYELPAIVTSQLSLQVHNLRLADTSLDHATIDIIIGAEYYLRCMRNQTKKIGTVELKETNFGRTPMGVAKSSFRKLDSKPHCFTSSLQSIESQLCNYFTVEDVVPNEPDLDIRASCEQHFEETYYQQPDGQFVVHPPTRANPVVLGNQLHNRAACCLISNDVSVIPS